MIRRPPRSTRTDTLFPYTTLFRSIPSTCDPLPNAGSMLSTIVVQNSAPSRMPPISGATSWLKVFAGETNHCRRKYHTEAKRSEEHTSELQSLMRISYAVFCLKKKKKQKNKKQYTKVTPINQH